MMALLLGEEKQQHGTFESMGGGLQQFCLGQ